MNIFSVMAGFLDATASQDSTLSEWGVHSPFKNSISLVTWWWNSEWGVHFPFKNSISHQSEEYILHLEIPSVWWWRWNSGDMMMEFSHQLGKTSIKKRVKRVTLGILGFEPTHPPLNSDIKISDICLIFLDLPTHWNSDVTLSKFGTLKTLIYLKLSSNMP